MNGITPATDVFRFRSAFALSVLSLALWVGMAQRAEAANMAMGFRVGEVTQDSAIVWTRVTRDKQRNWDGYRDETKREPRENKYTPSEVKVDDREGATPGAPGQVRVVYGTSEDLSGAKQTDWASVEAEHDFTHQFRLAGLKPATRYYLKVEARDDADAPVTASASGSFGTPADKETWQDVGFGVVTGQSYWDLDDRQGYHMYPAMQKLGLDFLVPTGDTVYLDSESPRARTKELARYHWHRMYSLPRHVEFHRHVPGYWEVDDHDTWANDCWPTMKAPWMNPLTFDEGAKIYVEQVPMGDHIYRTVRWGKGLQIWMVEGRLYRSPNNMKDGPEKTIWGKEQMAWLKRTISESDADFRVLISPTPIVGPDRGNKADNHANKAFTHEGDEFRNWTKEQGLENFYVCCGDRHWQYMSVHPESGLREFSCGPASDVHAGGSPMRDEEMQAFHRIKGGFLTVHVEKVDGRPTIFFRHRDVHGKVVNEFKATTAK
ncbi:MAG: alkaline phosphatase D family protein [Pirellulaceae bacterium]